MGKLFYIIKKAYGYRPGWIYLVLLSEFISFVTIFVNLYVPQYIFRYLFDEPSYQYAFRIIVIYGAVLLGLNLITSRIGFVIAEMEEAMCNSYSVELCEVKSSLLLMNLEDSKVMDLINELKEYDMHSFLGALHTFLHGIAQLATIVGVVAIMSRLNFLIVVLLTVILAANYLVAKKMEREGYKYMTDVQPCERKENYVLNIMGDFSFGKEVRVYGMIPFIHSKYLSVAGEMQRCYQNIFLSNLKAYLFENATTVIQKLGVYLLLAVEVVKRGLNIGDFTLYFNAVNQFSESIHGLLKGYLSLSKMGLYIGDLQKLMSLPRMDPPNVKESVEMGEELCIEFVDVSFRYPGSDAYALQHINLKITPGDRLAIVGTNGAGKTTLIKLMLRLYSPTEGKILLNGRDIRQFRYEEYAKIFSVVFQDYKLFAFSIRENICLSECCEERKMKDALDKSGLSEKIGRLPDKEGTLLFKAYDDSGVELSGGEAQKLGIARALYKDARVVILDEPTAALDPAAEYEIYQRFGTLVQGKTSIYISHRLASTRFADHILVLDQGAIVEQGKHIDLIRENGLYARMYQMQAEYYDTSLFHEQSERNEKTRIEIPKELYGE